MSDLREIRAALGEVAADAGFNAWDYEPDDPQHLPAAVVGGIVEMTRLNRAFVQFDLILTFYANTADPKDATSRLDTLLSTGVDGSFLDLLDLATAEDAPWSTCRFKSAGPYQRFSMPSGAVALGVAITLELTA